VSILTHSKLVRINKATQVVEPWLADSWSASEDGRAFTLKLHPGVTFSDGQPLTADDVVFSFQAVYALGPEGRRGDALQVEGRKLEVTAVDASTVSIVFPVTYAPGVRILDNLPIYPRHKLEAALRAGKIHDAWGLSTPPSELAGLGPFVLADYVPGQRLVFDRNPRYFRKAADGTGLPYLDRVTVEITPDPNTELLRLEAGQIDAMTIEVAPESYAAVKRAADAGKVKLADLGVGYNADALWFNLKPGAFAGDPRAAWLQRDELRKAISLAVDRKIFADTVFPVPPSQSTARRPPPTNSGNEATPPRTTAAAGGCWPASGSPIATATGCSRRRRPARRGSRCSRRRDGQTSNDRWRSSATS
jgi:peptide/nickel transport system substrate-binding protein